MKKHVTAITVSDKEGAEMIVYLQKLADIKESPEDALKGWKRMSESEKHSTVRTYNTFKSWETKS